MKFKSIRMITFFVILLILTGCEVKMTDKSGLDVNSLRNLGDTVGTNWINLTPTTLTIHPCPGNFDSKEISDPVVVKHLDKFYMWYSGKDITDIWRIGFATSYDGKNWTKDYDHNAVLAETKDSIDTDGLRVCSVIYDEEEGKYKMWYNGFKKRPLVDGETGTYYNCNVIFASSSSPNSDWEKYPNNGSPSSVRVITYDYSELSSDYHKVCVLKEMTIFGAVYRMWYTQFDKIDGINDPPNEPAIMNVSGTNEWLFYQYLTDIFTLYKDIVPYKDFFTDGSCMPTVIKDYYKDSFVYKVWFNTKKKDSPYKLGFGNSTILDSTTFTPYKNNPIFSGESVLSPCVIRSNDRYMMWFVKKELNGSTRIYYQESF